jgi:hypothetical protein
MGKVTRGPSNYPVSAVKATAPQIITLEVEKIVYVDRPVDVIKEVIVEKEIEVIKEITIDRPVEVIKEVIVEVEKPIFLERIVEKQVIKYNNVIDIEALMTEKRKCSSLEHKNRRLKLVIASLLILSLILGIKLI